MYACIHIYTYIYIYIHIYTYIYIYIQKKITFCLQTVCIRMVAGDGKKNSIFCFYFQETHSNFLICLKKTQFFFKKKPIFF